MIVRMYATQPMKTYPAFQTNNGSTAQISPHQQVRHCTRWQRQGIKLSRSARMELAVLPDGWKGDSTKNCFCSQGGVLLASEYSCSTHILVGFLLKLE